MEQYKTAIQKVGKSLYDKVHKWIKKNYGIASKCEHCGIEDKRIEWALKKECEYDFRIENFIQLCCSCHRKYDFHEDVARRISKTLTGRSMNKGQIVTPEKREQIRKKLSIPIIQLSTSGQLIRVWDSTKAAYDQLKIGNITPVLKGKRETAGGFKWRYATCQ